MPIRPYDCGFWEGYLEFTKMHGAGNDFCLFNGMEQTLPDYGALALTVCDRHFGVGGDGIMVCLESRSADVRMVYVNSDGNVGEMCGNGIRCFAKYVFENGIVTKPEFTVETMAGIKTIRLQLDGKGAAVTSVTVGMGRPGFNAEAVPTTLPGNPVVQQSLDVGGKHIKLTAMRLGVPHCVMLTDELDALDINGLGRQVEVHPAFPEKTNINFAQIVDRSHIRVKTWERAAGRTLACGTGCCSSVVAGRLMGLLDDTVTVQAEGGTLSIHVSPEYDVTMTGGAEFICRGTFSEWVVRQVQDRIKESFPGTD